MLPMSCSHYIRFYFESTLYRQIDGVVVGSPLDRTLADVFLSMTRSKLEDFISKLVLRKRNVDDITINVPTNFANVLNLLNSVHSNLSVSHEESNDWFYFSETIEQDHSDLELFVFVFRKFYTHCTNAS